MSRNTDLQRKPFQINIASAINHGHSLAGLIFPLQFFMVWLPPNWDGFQNHPCLPYQIAISPGQTQLLFPAERERESYFLGQGAISPVYIGNYSFSQVCWLFFCCWLESNFSRLKLLHSDSLESRCFSPTYIKFQFQYCFSSHNFGSGHDAGVVIRGKVSFCRNPCKVTVIQKLSVKLFFKFG